MRGRFSNVLRTERAESETSSFRKPTYFPVMLNMEIIEKEPLKILDNSLSIKIFLPLSITFFFTFQRSVFLKRYYCFPEDFVIWNFFYIQITTT